MYTRAVQNGGKRKRLCSWVQLAEVVSSPRGGRRAWHGALATLCFVWASEVESEGEVEREEEAPLRSS